MPDEAPLRVEELRVALTRAATLLRAASQAAGRVAESCDESAIRAALENYLECHAQVATLSRRVDDAIISEAECRRWITRLFSEDPESIDHEAMANRRLAVDALLRVQLHDVVTDAFAETRQAMERHIDHMERAFMRGAERGAVGARRRHSPDQ